MDRIVLEPGMLALLRIGSMFRLSTGEIPYRGVFFTAFDDRDPPFAGDSVVMTAPPHSRRLAALMEREARATGPASREVLIGMGWALTWQVLPLADRTQQPRDPLHYAKFCAERAREAIDASLYDGRGARETLASLPLSYRQLARYFTATYGVSPKRYQMQARLREATRLLTETTLPITTITYELGFSSSQHFATRFHAVTGSTPTDFRNSV